MESVEFKLELNGAGFDNRWPRCKVSVNETLYFDDIVQGKKEIVFSAELEEESKNKLVVDYYNRNYKKDVILGPDGMPKMVTAITIGNLSVDGIDLENIPYRHSYQDIYEPWYLDQDRENFPNPRKEDMQLSWNGRWTLEFTAPVYIWLLENL